MAGFTLYEGDIDGLFDIEFDDIAQEALTEAAPILQKELRSSAMASVKHDGDSEMANSIRASAVKKVSRTDCWIVNVGPRGYSSSKTYFAKNGKGVHTTRKYKVSNALKAIWKEYGIPGHQAAQPFIQKAVNQSKARVEKIIEDSFNKRIKDYEL